VKLDLVIALSLWVAGFAIFGRFIAPRWKIPGKLAFYLIVAALLSWLAGHWSLIWIVGHPLLGIAAHIAWCRRHGIHWLTCQPREVYLRLRPWAAEGGERPREDREPAGP
jgi:hypothetical protein